VGKGCLVRSRPLPRTRHGLLIATAIAVGAAGPLAASLSLADSTYNTYSNSARANVHAGREHLQRVRPSPASERKTDY
jgi:hypothetical protein